MSQKDNIWDKWGVIIGMVGLVIGSIFSGIALIQTHSLSQKSIEIDQQSKELTELSLYLQNITSNFEPKIIPYYITASVGDISTNMPVDDEGEVRTYGSLNISLIIVTPHASIINFTETSFDTQIRQATDEKDWINSSSFIGAHAYLTPYLPFGESGLNYSNNNIEITGFQYFHYWPQAFVQPGVTQINFTVAIHATIPINRNFQDIAIGARLGTVFAQIDLFDVQTNKIATKYEINEPIMLNINIR